MNRLVFCSFVFLFFRGVVAKNYNLDKFVQANFCKANVAADCFAEIDSDGDGIVSDEQIRRWWNRADAKIHSLDEQKWQNEYLTLDGDSEGLTMDKMDQVAIQKGIVPDSSFRELVKQFDVDGNGKINEKEFKDFQSRWFVVPGNVTFSWLQPGQN